MHTIDYREHDKLVNYQNEKKIRAVIRVVERAEQQRTKNGPTTRQRRAREVAKMCDECSGQPESTGPLGALRRFQVLARDPSALHRRET